MFRAWDLEFGLRIQGSDDCYRSLAWHYDSCVVCRDAVEHAPRAAHHVFQKLHALVVARERGMETSVADY